MAEERDLESCLWQEIVALVKILLHNGSLVFAGFSCASHGTAAHLHVHINNVDLARRAVEELLSEAARARVRAETMGAVGWARCPLRSTNKRFLFNTLRTTTLQHHSGGTGASQSEAREPRDGRQGAKPRSRRPSDHDHARSRSPVRTAPPTPPSRPPPPSNTHMDRPTTVRNLKHTHRPTAVRDTHTQSNRASSLQNSHK